MDGEMRNAEDCISLVLSAIHEIGEKPSVVYVQKEFGCSNIFLGFGKPQSGINPKYVHCELEVGSFSGYWRILADGRLLVAGGDSLSESDFNAQLKTIFFGALKEVVVLSPLDIRMVFEENVMLDFLCGTREDDVFHAFMPDKRIVALNPLKGWRVEGSRKHWRSDNED